MEIIPVIDVYRQQVVHAVAGDRDHYQPLRSKVTSSCHPLEVARAFREQFGFEKQYVADLDGIRDGNANLEMIRQLVSDGFSLILDAGIEDAPIAKDGCTAWPGHWWEESIQWVFGLESISSLETIQDLGRFATGKKFVFSLDLKNGKPLTPIAEWRDETPFNIARQVIDFGFRELIVLDLAGVGVSTGCPTLELCREIREYCDLQELACRIITGGGIRNREDVAALEQAGVDAALVSTALHNGELAVHNSSNTIG